MKHTKNILGTMLLMTAVVATSSCVDDKLLAYQVEKPASIAGCHEIRFVRSRRWNNEF